MKNRKFMLRENESGISEVVATLLVLVITVTLFSSIFAWINAMPPPMSKTYTEFSAKLDTVYVAGNYSFYVNITHAGGEILYASATTIIIRIENYSQSFTLGLSDGDKDGTLTDGKWEPGEVWRWNSAPTYSNTSTVIVQIIDKVKNLLVWSSILYPQITEIPPAILERGVLPDPVSIGGNFKVWANVKDDDLNFDSVYVNLSALGISTPVKMNQTFGWKFETSNITCNAQAGKYLALINATDTMGHVSTATLSITVSAAAQEETQPPKLIVERILLSNFSPTRGDTVTITAIIKNLNSMPAVSSNVSFWDYIPLTDTWSYIGWANVSVAGYGQSQAYMYWTATPGGLHKIFVNITSVMPGNSNGIGANISLVVTPKILLVDDDGAIMGSGSNLDVASYMAAALDAANLNYRIYSVPFGLDGPKYDSGPVETQMQYFDVVIWVSGNTNNSLTSNDTAELVKFLSGTSTVPAGKLWLVGENILEGVSSTFMNYIGINGLLPAISLPAQIYGQNPGVGWINLSNCQPLMDGSTFSIVRPINPLASLNVQAVFMNGSADQYYGIQYKNVVSGREYKVVTFTFEFAAMRDMGDQAITAYKVVNWLSGLGNRTGEDLAVASQYIVPINPRYMQPVNISATVRNNGASVQANVEVVAYIYVNGALLDTVSPVNTSITLQPDGGSQLVNFTWVPRMVGTYVIRVVVDPNNKVTETNEDNNALSTAVGIHEINVLYTLLVVDDDSSAENGGGGTLPNVAQYVIDALTSLGYVNGTDMDIQKVPRGADRNNTEYNVTNYNCILWVTGFASNGSGYNTLTSTDMQIIKDFYLPSDPAQHTFILIGREVLGDSGVSGTAFMTQVLGAASAGTKYTDGVGKVVYGVKESPVTNGMRVEYTNGTSFPCYAYTKTASAIPLFWANGTTYWDRTTDLVMGTGVKDISGWHSAFLSFDLSYTTNFSLVKEILFNLIHWGGRVDAIPELRVTSPDIYAGTNSRPYIILPELNPQIGSSYLLKANITNVGGLSGDVIVRFLDGDTIINSVNIHVPESYADASNNVYNGKCVAEIIWTPLYAGYERISAIIDPDNLYVGSEKLRENNNASQQIQVFFFYDDMEVPERTAENWNHDATLLNINGESPLDFLARKDVSTRVIGDWDWNVSGSQDFNGTTTFNGNGTYLTNNATVLNYTGGAAHTTPTAYWLPETQGRVTIKRNADVIMMFDVSGSMSWDLQTRMYAAKAAGGILLDTLNEGDRAALARFNTQSYLNIRFTSNLGTVRQSVLSLFPGGGTAFLDATAVSVRYATGVPSTWSWANNFNYNDHNTSNFPAAIVLTDGQTNSDQTFTTYDSCISEITKYDVALFTIAFGGDADRANMWRLAYAMNHTGKSNANYSKHFNVSTPAELITAFKEISAIIKEAAGGDVRVPLLAPTKVRPKAVETVYAQNFELGSDWSIGGTGASWAVGQPTTWVGGAHSGTRCAATNLGGNYNDGEASWFCSPLINLTAYKNGNVTLTFWAAYNFYHWSYYWAGYPYRDYYDHALLQVSIDGGVTWTVLHSFPDENADGNGQLASWRQYTINLTQYVGKEIYLRFTMQDDDNVVYSYSVQGNDRNSGIYIDDITITAERGENDGVDIGYTLFPAHYRFLTTPAVRVGTPYLSFWNYASGSYETGNLPDHVVVIDYENHYYWLYNDTGAVAFEGNFVVLQNNSYTGNASKTGALNVAPVTCLYNPTPSQDVWFNINDYYGWKIFSLPAVPHAVTDMLIAWEDLWGTVPNNQIDGNGDQWVRVTLLDDGTFRVVPYRASGGYEHDFFIGSDWVYIKHHGEAWSNGAGTSADPYKEVTVVPSGQRFPVFMRKSEGGILSFYTKYSITPGTNGGFLYLWGSTDGRTWVWDRNHRVYLSPRQPYNGNLKMDALTNETTTGGLTGNGWIDIDGKMPYWCFNGKSAGGTYGWEKIEVDLAKYVRTFASIRIVFVFAQFGGMLPPEWRPDMGWYIDDVQIRVRGGVPDYWKIVENASQARSGSRFWYFNSPSDYLPLGVDSSLYTIPIDLTRAYRATLIAFFKFNINDGAGLPPDGVRVEVSKDNGETWYSITYGVRIGWGYTGRDLTTVENRGYYGVTGDATGGELPQRYSGVRGTLYKTNWTFVRASDANTVSAYDWVPSFTLVRLNCDLSGFAGNTIILRIRVFTNATGSETDAVHYASASYNKGVFVDDVFVIGNSIIHGLQGGGERCARP